jgi:nickel-dependent lactate racemase
VTDITARVTAAWGAWTGETVSLEMPSGCTPVPLRMEDAPAMSPDAIDRALEHPVGAEPLADLAAGRSRAVIAIDDITRPTRTAPIVAKLVDRLLAAGMSPEAVTIVMATGAHGAPSAHERGLKVGVLPAGVRVVSHDPVEEVDDTGVALAGQPVRVNRAYLAADLRIGVSGVMPHPFAGFSGGGKVVLPGLSDLDAVVRSHKYALMGFGGGLRLEGNRFRADMERAVREIGLDWTVNLVMNSRCETAALVAGDLEAAHRAAAARAREIGRTVAPTRLLDCLVLNAYPKDSELLQVEAALVALRGGMLEWLTPEAPVVLLGACPDGLGAHQLFGPGGRLFRKPTQKAYLGGRQLHVVSHATAADGDRSVFWPGYPYHETWGACARALTTVLPATAAIGVATCGPLHVPSDAGWAVAATGQRQHVTGAV